MDDEVERLLSNVDFSTGGPARTCAHALALQSRDATLDGLARGRVLCALARVIKAFHPYWSFFEDQDLTALVAFCSEALFADPLETGSPVLDLALLGERIEVLLVWNQPVHAFRVVLAALSASRCYATLRALLQVVQRYLLDWQAWQWQVPGQQFVKELDGVVRKRDFGSLVECMATFLVPLLSQNWECPVLQLTEPECRTLLRCAKDCLTAWQLVKHMKHARRVELRLAIATAALRMVVQESQGFGEHTFDCSMFLLAALPALSDIMTSSKEAKVDCATVEYAVRTCSEPTFAHQRLGSDRRYEVLHSLMCVCTTLVKCDDDAMTAELVVSCCQSAAGIMEQLCNTCWLGALALSAHRTDCTVFLDEVIKWARRKAVAADATWELKRAAIKLVPYLNVLDAQWARFVDFMGQHDGLRVPDVALRRALVEAVCEAGSSKTVLDSTKVRVLFQEQFEPVLMEHIRTLTGASEEVVFLMKVWGMKNYLISPALVAVRKEVTEAWLHEDLQRRDTCAHLFRVLVPHLLQPYVLENRGARGTSATCAAALVLHCVGKAARAEMRAHVACHSGKAARRVVHEAPHVGVTFSKFYTGLAQYASQWWEDASSDMALHVDAFFLRCVQGPYMRQNGWRLFNKRPITICPRMLEFLEQRELVDAAVFALTHCAMDWHWQEAHVLGDPDCFMVPPSATLTPLLRSCTTPALQNCHECLRRHGGAWSRTLQEALHDALVRVSATQRF
jgi:hypothetical protein